MTQTTLAARVRVRLCDLGLAPENLRASEPEDNETPRLAETIRAAGLLYPLLVRRGRKGESPYMVLDGRRRRYALLRLADSGAISPDHEVECVVAGDKAARAAALVVSNAERTPIHTADVILAIGKLRRARMETAAIAAALGYDELEIRRLDALAGVHPKVLEAFRAGKLTLRLVRMFARLDDRARQAEIAQQALEGYYVEHQLGAIVRSSRVTEEDPRLALVGLKAYAEAGGRVLADLFGETPDVLLDPAILDRVWSERAAALSQDLEAAGLSVRLTPQRDLLPPEGLARVHLFSAASVAAADRDAYSAALASAQVAREAIGDPAAPEADPAIRAMIEAGRQAAELSAKPGRVTSVGLAPSAETGLEAAFYAAMPEVEALEAKSGDDGDRYSETSGPAEPRRSDVETAAVEVATDGGHALHRLRTTVATRLLLADLADQPEAAAIVLTAHLFKLLALRDRVGADASALTISARALSSDLSSAEGVQAAVRARLADHRDAYLAAGLRPIPFVASLAAESRAALLAELVASALDLTEPRTDGLRRAARAEAAEIAELCQAPPAARWTPDAAFLRQHSKAQLLALLGEMGAEEPSAVALPKPQLVALVAERAAAAGWAPRAVSFATADPETSREPVADGEALTTAAQAGAEGREDALETSDPPETSALAA